MSWLGECWRRVRFRSWRTQFEKDLDEEMRLHRKRPVSLSITHKF